MAVLDPEQLSNAQWDYLVSTFTAEMAVGKRLTAVKDVRTSLSLWTEYIPAVGVALTDSAEAQRDSKQHLLTCTFTIVAGAQSTVATAAANGYSIPNMDDAVKQVRAIVADGAGNGICSILRDPNNRTLGGNAGFSRIGRTQYQQVINPGANVATDDPEIWCYAFIELITQQFVAIV